MRDRDTKRGGGGGGNGGGGGGGGGNSGGRRGRSGKPRLGKTNSKQRGTGLFDRKARCPLLARVFVRVGAVDPEKRTKMTAAGNGFAGLVHRLFDEGAFFKKGANIEADEVQMHTWMDATLQEILTAVLKAKPELADPDVVRGYHFAVVKNSSKRIDYLGQAAPSDNWDNKLDAKDRTTDTLFSFDHIVGEYLLLVAETFEEPAPQDFKEVVTSSEPLAEAEAASGSEGSGGEAE